MMTMRFSILFLVASIAGSSWASPESYSDAKRIARILFSSKPLTLYCACAYSRDFQIDLANCNMLAATRLERAQYVEWEHMMPVEQFGHHFECWNKPVCTNSKGNRYKGRKCCQKIDERYQEIEAELYNLWPSVGAINEARANFRFAAIKPKHGFLGCDIEIDEIQHKVSPDDRAKGIVARANLFMAYKYNIPLNSSQKKLLQRWHKQFPASNWEKTWAISVAKVEGYENPYMDD